MTDEEDAYRGKAMSDALAKLNEQSKTPLSLKFPINNEATYHTHHIIFRVFELKRESRNSSDKKIAKAEIMLPMTMELQAQYNAAYTSQDLGAVAAELVAGTESLSGMIAGSTNPLEFAKKIGEKVTSMTPSDVGRGLGSVASAAVSQALGSIGTTAQAAVAAATGASRNPHKAVLFEGTEFRSHSFQFRFSPVVAAESDAIKRIIHVFKYHMHPGYAGETFLGVDFSAGNHFFKNPEFFEIELSNRGKYTINDYRTCVLKNMTVNYQPSNYPAYARSGQSIPAPMEVVMNLDFQEIDIITKAVIGSPYADVPSNKPIQPKAGGIGAFGADKFVDNGGGAATGMTHTKSRLEEVGRGGGLAARAAQRQLGG